MIIAYIFTGEEERNEDGDFIVPENATHVSVHPSVKVIPAELFSYHQNIVELICHDGVERIKRCAFKSCPRLRRVICRGVKVAERGAFCDCDDLVYVECPKLEKIEYRAFDGCKSLSDINLTSVKIVEEEAFTNCEALTEAKFGSNLESLESRAFMKCPSLESITIPLKYDLFTAQNTFIECANLKWVDLVEAAVLHETTTALLLEEWRNDMNEEIDSINQILPNVYAGEFINEDRVCFNNPVGKATAIREWIERVLRKIINYKAHHCQLLTEVFSTLQLALPNDIVTNSVVPFLELPFHKIDREDEDEEDEEETIDNDDGSECTSEDSGEEGDAFVDGGDDEDEQEREDGEDEEESGESEVSSDGEGHEEEEDDEGGGKRRKTANDH